MTLGLQDRIFVELVRSHLDASVAEMGATLRRATDNPLIHSTLAFSCSLHDASGEELAAEAGIPSFLGAMEFPVRAAIEAFGLDELRPGDVLISNDPYLAGGTHVSDINVICPIFHDDRVRLLAAVKAHWIDVGGMRSGSWSPDATDCFQEGLRLPPVRIVSAGTWNEDILGIIFANVRAPLESRADLSAQIAGCRLAEGRMLELFQWYGEEPMVAAFERILDHGEALMRARLLDVPDGEYHSSDLVDEDGVRGEPVRVQVAISVRGSDVVVDFAGTQAQTEGANGNETFAETVAAARLALRCLVGPHLPENGGCYRPIEVRADKGTCVNPTAPAPVTVGNAAVNLVVTDSIFRAMAEPLPDRVTADQYGGVQVLLLTGHTAAGREFTHFEPYAGGGGARATKDGLNSVITIQDGDVRSESAELTESPYALRVERRELIRDSGGPGRQRGGLGIATDYRVLGDGVHGMTTLTRFRVAPQGILGGDQGTTSATVLEDGGAERVMFLGEFKLPHHGLVSHRIGGGGGYGDPLLRAPALVAADVENGYVSRAAARDRYGVVLDESGRLDVRATEHRRAERAAETASAP
jgi:N-methylhydantoinase B